MADVHMPGTRIDYMGEQVTVGAVGITGGERYYWLTYDDGAVAMIPAIYIDTRAPTTGEDACAGLLTEDPNGR